MPCPTRFHSFSHAAACWTASGIVAAAALTPSSARATLTSSFSGNVGLYSYATRELQTESLSAPRTASTLPLFQRSVLVPETTAFVQTSQGVQRIALTTTASDDGVLRTSAGLSAESDWTDTFTISAPGRFLQQGVATFQMRIDGQLGRSDAVLQPTASIVVTALGTDPSFNGANAVSYRLADNGSGPVESWQAASFEGGVLRRSFTFTYGLPFAIESNVVATAAGGGNVAFASTIQSGLVLPASATLQTASGAGYAPLAPVPEPAAWLQLAAGLALLARLRPRARSVHCPA